MVLDGVTYCSPEMRSLRIPVQLIVLTPAEIERLIGATKKLRYRVFLLSTYSMGLRLEEALSLQVGDIDAGRKLVHIRRGKGHKGL